MTHNEATAFRVQGLINSFKETLTEDVEYKLLKKSFPEQAIYETKISSYEFARQLLHLNQSKDLDGA